MSWNPRDTVNLRLEFVRLALQKRRPPSRVVPALRHQREDRLQVAHRYAQSGEAGLEDRSRRPLSSPNRTPPEIEQRVVSLRNEHRWGGRKLERRLRDLGEPVVPTAGTVTRIVHRHGLTVPEASVAATPWKRFEHEQPNDLWQMDFKGWIELNDGRRCSPLTVLDDHSRFNVVLDACGTTDTQAVRRRRRDAFRRYGLPLRINADNGSPWGSPAQPGQLTMLGIWLIRLGVKISYSRPAHPQTNGKDERFHRTLKPELLSGRHFASFCGAQRAFDTWRIVYNTQRPHQTLDMDTPITRYRPSPRPYPERLPPLKYGDADTVVRVRVNGELRFMSRRFKVSSALENLPVAIRRSTTQPDCYDLYIAHHHFDTINLNLTK
ncbi:IS481 family transposase [Paraburkholderia sp. USG1]|uniref:IS481 family transposase n=1 Tax=Paraburkholderia sp. USG1 TaxID=2952268 RepID=UPI0028702CC4|nr:IS481 family transposase [Paraburkholderia sp. USG1]